MNYVVTAAFFRAGTPPTDVRQYVKGETVSAAEAASWQALAGLPTLAVALRTNLIAPVPAPAAPVQDSAPKPPDPEPAVHPAVNQT